MEKNSPTVLASADVVELELLCLVRALHRAGLHSVEFNSSFREMNTRDAGPKSCHDNRFEQAEMRAVGIERGRSRNASPWHKV